MTFSRFDFSEFVELAKLLSNEVTSLESQSLSAVNSPQVQAKVRTAISRAYYGAFQEVFLYTRDVLQDQETLISRGRGTGPFKHEYIAELYATDKFSKKKREIGTKLNNLRRSRNFSDYDAKPSVKRISEARNAVTDAVYVLEKLEEIQNGD